MELKIAFFSKVFHLCSVERKLLFLEKVQELEETQLKKKLLPPKRKERKRGLKKSQTIPNSSPISNPRIPLELKK